MHIPRCNASVISEDSVVSFLCGMMAIMTWYGKLTPVRYAVQ
jgi:hypothetical protein